jgi:hypothetical protein
MVPSGELKRERDWRTEELPPPAKGFLLTYLSENDALVIRVCRNLSRDVAFPIRC